MAPSTYHDSAQINNAMSEIISTGYDAVVMCPQDYDANASAIDEAYNAGLPVICLDSLTASENYITSICTDNKAAGAEAAAGRGAHQAERHFRHRQGQARRHGG